MYKLTNNGKAIAKNLTEDYRNNNLLPKKIEIKKEEYEKFVDFEDYLKIQILNEVMDPITFKHLIEPHIKIMKDKDLNGN